MKKTITAIITLLIVAIGIWYYTQTPSEATPPNGEPITNQGGLNGEAGTAQININPN